jgi:hypothetical protein
MSAVHFRQICFALVCCAAAFSIPASTCAQEHEKVTACDLQDHPGNYNRFPYE